MKVVLNFLILLIFLEILSACSNEYKVEVRKNDDTLVTRSKIATKYLEKITGLWYYPTLRNSYIEIKNLNWQTNIPQFNLYLNANFHFIDSNKLVLETYKSSVKEKLGDKDTIQIIKVDQNEMLFVIKNNVVIDTVNLVKNSNTK